MVVPFPPGGSPDLIGRYLADRLVPTLGQAVVIDNKAGASGALGTTQVAQAAPDGHTLLMASTGPLSVNPAVIPGLQYDPLTDLEPVILVGKSALVLMVNLDVPARDLRELLDLARRRPGALSYGSAGSGNLTHLVGELMKAHARVDILHVPYKGTAALKPDLLAGRISMFFDTVPAAIPMIRAGQVRALAVTSRERSSIAPDLPTFVELGVSGDFDVSGWFAVMAPKRTPAAAIARINAEVNRILQSDEAKEKFVSWGVDIVGGRPETLRTLMVGEIARWKEVVRVAQIKSE
jgi:tripartite-type tricarboxylate transporter receptor subunit TctC